MLDAMYMIVLRLYNGHAVIGTLRMFNLIAVLEYWYCLHRAAACF